MNCGVLEEAGSKDLHLLKSVAVVLSDKEVFICAALQQS